MSAETWRVVCEGGEVKRPDVGSVGDGDYVAMTGEPDDEYVGDGTTQRAAILDLCRVAGWDATELVAPGAQTADERVAQAIVERDAAVAARDALAGAVREVGDLIVEHGCSCDCGCTFSSSDGEHTSECDPCLACRVSNVVSPVRGTALDAAPAAAGGGR